MKSGQVLRITRPTLAKYIKEGYIKGKLLPNDQYDYDANSVYSFLNKGFKRKTVIYTRVSTSKESP